jgi:hypothetical protein
LGFPTGRSSTRHQAIFLAPLPGIEEEEAPMPTARQAAAPDVGATATGVGVAAVVFESWVHQCMIQRRMC